MITYLNQTIHFRQSHHISTGASKVAGAVSDSDCSHGLSFPSRKLKNELAVVLRLRFKDSKGGAVECTSPIVEVRTLGRYGNRLKIIIK